MKKGFRNLPIRRKIVAVTVVASVVALLITGVAALVYELTSFRPKVIAELRAKVEILRIVDELTEQGVAVAIVSDELSELIDTCDRIVVFYRGQIAREFIKGTDEMTPATLLAAIEGGAGEASHAMA